MASVEKFVETLAIPWIVISRVTFTFVAKILDVSRLLNNIVSPPATRISPWRTIVLMSAFPLTINEFVLTEPVTTAELTFVRCPTTRAPPTYKEFPVDRIPPVRKEPAYVSNPMKPEENTFKELVVKIPFKKRLSFILVVDPTVNELISVAELRLVNEPAVKKLEPTLNPSAD